jgi:hypothetical protein
MITYEEAQIVANQRIAAFDLPTKEELQRPDPDVFTYKFSPEQLEVLRAANAQARKGAK